MSGSSRLCALMIALGRRPIVSAQQLGCPPNALALGTLGAHDRRLRSGDNQRSQTDRPSQGTADEPAVAGR
jgi:hypothetical protein